MEKWVRDEVITLANTEAQEQQGNNLHLYRMLGRGCQYNGLPCVPSVFQWQTDWQDWEAESAFAHYSLISNEADRFGVWLVTPILSVLPVIRNLGKILFIIL